jgi:SAM-dependent methyltransferase
VPYLTPELAAEYSALADAYARLWSPVIRPMALPIFDLLPLADARDVLDVGTGAGDLYADLKRRAPGARLVGVDRSEGMLRLARARGVTSVAVMDAQRLAFPPASFDAAVCIFVLFHLPDPLQGLRELRRVLRPGGRVGLVTWGEDPGPPGAAIWRRELDAAGAAPDPRDPGVMQHSLMDAGAKVEGLLREAGFTAVETGARKAEHPFTADSLLEVQVSCGLASRRLPSLPGDARARVRARVEKQLRALSAAQLAYRPEAIFAVAESPAWKPSN